MLKAPNGRTLNGSKHQKDICEGDSALHVFVPSWVKLEEQTTVCAVFREPLWSKTTHDERVTAINYIAKIIKIEEWPHEITKKYMRR